MLYRFQKLSFLKARLLILFLGAVISCAGYSNSEAQQVEKSDSDLNYWVHAGPSISTLGPGVQGGLVFDYNRHLFSLRATSTDFQVGEETWDIAFLYGRSIRYQSLYLSAGAGVSVVGGVGYSDLFGRNNRSDIETSIGFPLEGQVSWEPVNLVSLGVYSFVNVNTEQPFGGIGFTIRIGQL